MEQNAVTTFSTHNPPTDQAPRLDARLARRLSSIAGRIRTFLFIEGIAWVLCFVAAAAAIQFIADYGTRGLEKSIRGALLVAAIVALLVVIWRRLIAPLRVRIDETDVANLVERRYPGLSSRLISAVRFARGEVGGRDTNSPALVASVISAANRAADQFDFREVVDSHRARWSAGLIVAVLALIAIPALAAPDYASLWLARNIMLSDTPWPKRTNLIVEGAEDGIIAARGDDLVIQARAVGVEPSVAEFFYRTESGDRGRQTMVVVGRDDARRYRHTFKDVKEPFTFYLEGGDDRTEEFPVRIVDRPKLTRSRVEISAPEYAGLPDSTLKDGELTAEVLPGSRVRFLVETNKPVVNAILMAGSEVMSEATTDGNGYTAEIVPDATRLYHFSFVDEHGFDNKDVVKFALRVIKDEAPQVRLRADGVGEMVTSLAVLPLEVEFADSYGLATAELLYRVTHEDLSQDLIPLPGFKPHTTSFSTSLDWPVSSTLAVAGDQLGLLAVASDFDDVSGPNVAESPEIVLRVVTADELLAELNRREQEFRSDFERLIDAQERVRGELLTLMGPAGPTPASQEFVAAAAGLERRQRSIAQSVNVVRQQVEQVLQELRINQLSNEEVEERLGEQVAVPLTQLSRRELPQAADQIRQWSRDAAPETAERIDPHQVALLSQMRAVLANMIEWEGYQEAVGMLRDILRLQNELKTETQRALEKEAGDIFDQ